MGKGPLLFRSTQANLSRMFLTTDKMTISSDPSPRRIRRLLHQVMIAVVEPNRMLKEVYGETSSNTTRWPVPLRVSRAIFATQRTLT